MNLNNLIKKNSIIIDRMTFCIRAKPESSGYARSEDLAQALQRSVEARVNEQNARVKTIASERAHQRVKAYVQAVDPMINARSGVIARLTAEYEDVLPYMIGNEKLRLLLLSYFAIELKQSRAKVLEELSYRMVFDSDLHSQMVVLSGGSMLPHRVEDFLAQERSTRCSAQWKDGMTDIEHESMCRYKYDMEKGTESGIQRAMLLPSDERIPALLAAGVKPAGIAGITTLSRYASTTHVGFLFSDIYGDTSMKARLEHMKQLADGMNVEFEHGQSMPIDLTKFRREAHSLHSLAVSIRSSAQQAIVQDPFKFIYHSMFLQEIDRALSDHYKENMYGETLRILTPMSEQANDVTTRPAIALPTWSSSSDQRDQRTVYLNGIPIACESNAVSGVYRNSLQGVEVQTLCGVITGAVVNGERRDVHPILHYVV